jgi:anti-anti-sigma regulatory factor
MLVPVYEPPAQVDSTNIGRFRLRITELTARYGAIVVDCSEVDVIGPSGMRVLRLASRDANVTLVNPNPSLQLMATAYGFDTDLTATARAAAEPTDSGAPGEPGVPSMTRRPQ